MSGVLCRLVLALTSAPCSTREAMIFTSPTDDAFKSGNQPRESFPDTSAPASTIAFTHSKSFASTAAVNAFISEARASEEAFRIETKTHRETMRPFDLIPFVLPIL